MVIWEKSTDCIYSLYTLFQINMIQDPVINDTIYFSSARTSYTKPESGQFIFNQVDQVIWGKSYDLFQSYLDMAANTEY